MAYCEKNLDGFWTLRHETTVNEGIDGFVLKPGALQKNDANVFGWDLTRVLEQNSDHKCSPSSNPKGPLFTR